MKEILIWIAFFLFSVLAFWAMTGFVMWNWNPADWSNGARFVVVCLSFPFGFFGGAALVLKI